MNITTSIGGEMGLDVLEILDKTPEIQIYINSSVDQYQWRDGRSKETSDVWKNKSFNTRTEMRVFLMEYLKIKGTI